VLQSARVCLHILTNSMDEVLVQKPIVTQLVKKYPAFYAVRKLITFFTRERQSTLS